MGESTGDGAPGLGERGVDPSSWRLHPAFRGAASAELARVVRAHWKPSSVPRPELEAFVREVASAAAARPTTLCVVVHRGNFPTIDYVAVGLRSAGRAVFGAYLFTDPPAGAFDAAVSCGGSLAALAEVLRRVPEVSLYVQAHARWAFLGQFVRAIRPDLRTFQEVYDWMDTFIDPASEEVFVDQGAYAREEISLMRAAEAFVREGLDGFVYKNGGARVRALVDRATSPSVQLVPCPPRAWMKPPVDPPAMEPLRLVYAGQIKNRTAPPAIFGDLHYLPVIRELTAQGVELVAYSSFTRDQADFERLYADYVAEADVNPRFSLERGVPPEDLIARMHGRFHFGLMLYRFDEGLVVGKDHLRGALASKLFTYLAAGLPVLVSEELEAMAKLVRDRGIGLVLGRGEHAHLAERLRAVDRRALGAAVAAAQDEFHIERYIPKIEALLAGEASRPGDAP